jgi:hypothetical protein
MTVSAIAPAALARTIERLQPGDKVRVVFTDGIDVTGTLGGASQILHPDSRKLVLNSLAAFRVIRNADGTPGFGIVSVDAWDNESRIDLIRTLARDLDHYELEAQRAEPAERGGLEKCAAEALAALRDAVLGGESR